MTPRARSASTLTALVVLLLGSGALGWKSLTSPFPEREALPTCVESSVRPGDIVFTDQVTVSIFNGSRTNGLASRTMADLVERGFHRGDRGNAPKRIKRGVQIWTANPTNPGVQLVAKQFRNPSIITKVDGEVPLGVGVVLVVGDNVTLRSVAKSPDQVVAEANSTLCTPPGHDTLLND